MRLPRHFKQWVFLYLLGTTSLLWYAWEYGEILHALKTNAVSLTHSGTTWSLAFGAFVPIGNFFYLVDRGYILRHRSSRFRWTLFAALGIPILVFAAALEIHVRKEMSRLGYIECAAQRSVGPRATVYHYYRDLRLCY